MKQKLMLVCLHPIISALNNAKTYLDTKNNWTGTNDIANAFFNKFFHTDDLHLLSENELKNKISENHEEINKFIKDNGFNYSIDPLNPGEFATCSILSVLVEWLKAANSTVNENELGSYDSIEFEDNFTVFKSKNEYLLKLNTKSLDSVYIKKLNSKEKEMEFNDVSLVKYCNKLQSNFDEEVYNFSSAVMPKLSLSYETDLEYLDNSILYRDNDEFKLKKSKQITKFDLDENGAKVESMYVGVITACSFRQPQILNIDDDFVIFITRNGLNIPYFSGIITKENFKYKK